MKVKSILIIFKIKTKNKELLLTVCESNIMLMYSMKSSFLMLCSAMKSVTGFPCRPAIE